MLRNLTSLFVGIFCLGLLMAPGCQLSANTISDPALINYQNAWHQFRYIVDVKLGETVWVPMGEYSTLERCGGKYWLDPDSRCWNRPLPAEPGRYPAVKYMPVTRTKQGFLAKGYSQDETRAWPVNEDLTPARLLAGGHLPLQFEP